MPRARNLPPYVQVLRRDGKIAGYRGWAMFGGTRKFGPTRRTANEAHRDALTMRGMGEAPAWGGAFETRANEWLASLAVKATEDTIAFYRSKLRNLYRTIPKTMPVDRITPPIVREFVREAREVHGLGARTVQHCRRTLNGFFRWMIRRGFLHHNPVSQVEWPKPVETQPDVFTREELQAALASITDTWAAALGILIACSGLRRAEVARLRVQDVDAPGRVLWVHGKTRAQAQPFAADADDAVALMLEAAKGREFVVSGTTDRARRNVIAETFRHWQRQLKEPRWHPHALRHSMVTILLREGTPNAAVQRAARHASYVTTQRYEHLIAADVRAGMTRLRILPKDEAAKQHG
ncbi:MAG: tyrosine-type recombinase/integrase [Planctomycetota bacterium]